MLVLKHVKPTRASMQERDAHEKELDEKRKDHLHKLSFEIALSMHR